MRTERQRRTAWSGPRLGLVSFLVALVVFAIGGGAAVFVADQVGQNVEMELLVTAITRSEDQMAHVQEREAEAFTAYQAGQTTRAELADELSQIAELGEVAVAAAGDDVAEVSAFGWHDRVAAARAAYLAHNRAWVDYLAKATSDPLQFTRPQDAVNETFAAAQEPLTAAVPYWDLFDLRTRVAQIFTDGTPTLGPTQVA